MLLTSNILMPIGTVFAERLLYFDCDSGVVTLCIGAGNDDSIDIRW